MKFSVLASGSSGNAIYIETDKTRLLVDAGISGKQLEMRMKKIGVSPTDLDAILISHEHIDHVKGLGVFARRYQLPIYMNRATWSHLPSSVGEISIGQKFLLPTGDSLALRDLVIETIPISHDAAEPIGFRIEADRQVLGIMTDMGYVNEYIVKRIQGVHTLVWESNHDVELLRMGRYPWNVKRRILSDVGHLSNKDAGEALLDILQGNEENVYLAHLSQDNNLSELAHMTVSEILNEAGLRVGDDVCLHETYAHQPTPLREVQQSLRVS